MSAIVFPLWRVIDVLYPAVLRDRRQRAHRMSIKGRLPHWAVLTLMLIASGAAIVVSDLLDWKWDHGLVPEFSKAIFVAGVLGLTIDRWLKTEIVSDVFNAAIGYFIPNEFQNEIRRITSFKFICESHDSWYTINRLDDDSVIVKVQNERKIRNITREDQAQRALINIDDWGFSEPSRILRCEIYDEKRNLIDKAPPAKTVGKTRLSAETKPAIIRPGQAVILVTEFIEIRRKNDQIVSVFLSPTKNPRIHVAATKFEYLVDFGVISPNTDDSAVHPTHTLDGVYFPPGNIRLRWWPKAQQELPSPTQ